MHDWSGTAIHRQALAVVCPACHAPIEARCVRDDGEPLTRFPAHTKRITLAQNPDATFTPEPSGPYIPRNAREDT
jgi:hypothetical protein